MMSQMINLPFGSEYDRWSWRLKLLLNKIATPHLALVQQLIKENYEEGVDIYNFLKAFLKA